MAGIMASQLHSSFQGLYSSELDDSIESSWEWANRLQLKKFQPESDGRKLLALKFVESVTLLYTADPSASSEPPADQTSSDEFNIAWLPILNVGDLSIEASRNLGLLLDQLRYPAVKSLSNIVVIVLIKSLSAIAKKRPAFYGRILPVLLDLDPSSAAVKAGHVSGVHHALKNAFLSCLRCTHPVGSLREMKAGGLAEEALRDVSRGNSSVAQDVKPSIEASNSVHSPGIRKRSEVQDVSDLNNDDDNGRVQQLVAMFSSLVAQGEQSAGMLEILISSISADLLAQVVMANMP
ncbi:symplekin isoform X1, partial [Tanacetum coccineum]